VGGEGHGVLSGPRRHTGSGVRALSVAAAHTGSAGLFHLGHNNPVTALSTLTKSGAGPALSLKVGSGPPLAVNSSAKVAKLNADTLDGQDSTTVGRELWAVINADGTEARARGTLGAVRVGTGSYEVFFTRNVTTCAYTATTTGGFAGQTGVREGPAVGAGTNTVRVFTVASNGTPTDLPYHLIVAC
jgi:hypothetical protein